MLAIVRCPGTERTSGAESLLVLVGKVVLEEDHVARPQELWQLFGRLIERVDDDHARLRSAASAPATIASRFSLATTISVSATSAACSPKLLVRLCLEGAELDDPGRNDDLPASRHRVQDLERRGRARRVRVVGVVDNGDAAGSLDRSAGDARRARAHAIAPPAPSSGVPRASATATPARTWPIECCPEQPRRRCRPNRPSVVDDRQASFPSAVTSISRAVTSGLRPRIDPVPDDLHLGRRVGERPHLGSSTFMTAMPSSGRLGTISYFALRIASIEPKRSRWAGPIAVRTPIVGCTNRQSSAISPSLYAPISTMKKLVLRVRCSLIVRQTPSGVLNEPGVASTSLGSPISLAIANFVEVLPNEPVTPTTSRRSLRSFARADSRKRALIALLHRRHARRLRRPARCRSATRRRRESSRPPSRSGRRAHPRPDAQRPMTPSEHKDRHDVAVTGSATPGPSSPAASSPVRPFRNERPIAVLLHHSRKRTRL